MYVLLRIKSGHLSYFAFFFVTDGQNLKSGFEKHATVF